MAMKCTDRGDDELVQKHTEDLNISMNTRDQEETGEFTLSSLCQTGTICNLCVISTSPVDESHRWNNDDEFEPLTATRATA